MIQAEPKSRARIEGICGSLEILIKVSKGLHVGSGKKTFLKIEEDKLKATVEKYGERSERAIEALMFLGLTQDILPFCESGGRPVIPGSSVKGNVRARLELSFRGKGGKVRSCFVDAGRGRRSWRHEGIWGERIREIRKVPVERDKKEERQCQFKPESRELNKVCLLCDLFGTTGLMGRLGFSDFIGDSVQLEDREFSYGMKLMVAPDESVFKGKVTFLNLQPEELGLLLLGMGLEKERTGRLVLMGRLKYREPIGKIKYHVESLYLSPLSTPLNVGKITVQPGQSVNTPILDQLVFQLISLAKSKFGDEIEVIDEVKRLDQIQLRR